MSETKKTTRVALFFNETKNTVQIALFFGIVCMVTVAGMATISTFIEWMSNSLCSIKPQ